MDNSVKYALTLFCLTFIVSFCFVFCDGIQWTKYDYKGETNGRCIQDATVFETEGQDVLSCGKMCHLQGVCESIVYDQNSQRCVGCGYRYDDTPAQENGKAHIAPVSFTKAEIRETDCLQILRNRPNVPSNTYEIRLWKSKKRIEVYCDMETDGGGWTVFQNRFDGRVDFNRNFSEYENGFGSLDGEFWLGLMDIQELAAQSPSDLRIDLSDGSGNQGYESFQGFQLVGKHYWLFLRERGRYSGGFLLHNEALDGFLSSSRNSFSTYDHDRDGVLDRNCAEDAGGWWYGGDDCGLVNLNYAYPDRDELVNSNGFNPHRGFRHFGFAGQSFLKASRMMVRRADVNP